MAHVACRLHVGGMQTVPFTASTLAAVPAVADDYVRAALPSNHVDFVRTLEEARRALRTRRYRLLLVAVHFDESRMLEALAFAKSLDAYRNVPIVCFQDTGARLPSGVARIIDVAVKVLGGRGFFDLGNGAAGLEQTRLFLRSLAQNQWSDSPAEARGEWRQSAPGPRRPAAGGSDALPSSAHHWFEH